MCSLKYTPLSFTRRGDLVDIKNMSPSSLTIGRDKYAHFLNTGTITMRRNEVKRIVSAYKTKFFF